MAEVNACPLHLVETRPHAPFGVTWTSWSQVSENVSKLLQKVGTTLAAVEEAFELDWSRKNLQPDYITAIGELLARCPTLTSLK